MARYSKVRPPVAAFFCFCGAICIAQLAAEAAHPNQQTYMFNFMAQKWKQVNLGLFLSEDYCDVVFFLLCTLIFNVAPKIMFCVAVLAAFEYAIW